MTDLCGGKGASWLTSVVVEAVVVEAGPSEGADDVGDTLPWPADVVLDTSASTEVAGPVDVPGEDGDRVSIETATTATATEARKEASPTATFVRVR